MYDIHPEQVYITDWTLRDERAVARAQRLAAAFGHPEPPVLTAAELVAVAHERGWLTGAARTGAARQAPAPDIVLSAFTFDEAEVQERLREYPALRPWMLAGHGPATLRDGPEQLGIQGTVCQTALEIHCAYGCFHACDYCHIGSVFNIMTNLEAFAAHVRQLVRENPWCRLWKFDNYTDTITLEPEYGASEVMVNQFATEPDAFLMLYTKSANVDHLLDLDHRGRTLISWSLGSDTASRVIEKQTPPLPERLTAMRRCAEAGYRVRARLSPICPLQGWQDEGTALVEDLFAQVQPELITMDVLGWMNARQMQEALDTDLLDDRFREFVAEQARREPGPHRKHLFPHEMRAEILRYYLQAIRRVSPKTPVSICMETTEMWAELGPELGMRPDDYACCCGPTSVPGHPLM